MNPFPYYLNQANEELLEAVRDRNITLVAELLHHPDLNYDIGNFRSILLGTLFCDADDDDVPEDFFLGLLGTIYDLKQKNSDNENLLHFATMYRLVNFVHELIKRGVDIHACDNRGRMPLSNAAFIGNLEAVCMLLYYGADANVKCNESMTPLMWALENDRTKSAKVLLKYTDLSNKSVHGLTALYIATEVTSPLALEILTIVDLENEQCEELLVRALDYETAELLKLMWSLFGDQVVVKPSFVKLFFELDYFLNEDWLEIWTLLVNSPRAKHIYKASFIAELNEDRFAHLMLKCLLQRGVEPDTRLDIIAFFVSLGVQIHEYDLNFVHETFLFKDELRFLILTYNYEQEVMLNRLDHKLRTLFTLEIESDIVCRHVLTQTMKVEPSLLGYFAVPQNDRFSIMQFMTSGNGTDPFWVQALERIPEVPSLVEASRNEIMKNIKKIYNITKASQYLEVVEKCSLPHFIKDILLLKTKIY